jgi:class 3 adenylate cyclase
LLFILVLLIVLKFRKRILRIVLISFLPIGAFVACLLSLSELDLWLGYAPIFISFWIVLFLHRTLSQVSLARSLRKAVGFDPRLIEAFRREGARTGGQVRKDVAILIADIRSYTRYVSRADPSIVSRVMAEYMQAMERCITVEGGYINKYVGDEIVAVFGFPLSADRCAERAVRAAISMLEGTARLVISWKSSNLPCFERIGIGIDAGSVVFAEVGGPTKSQFDIIGDCINGASRIENLTKDFEKGLLISEDANRALESVDSLAGSFELVKTVLVRGQGERRVFGLVRESSL